MKVHFVGCEGVSMRRLRELTEKFGNSTSGSDISLGGHDASNVLGAQIVVYSSAIREDNPELVYARAHNIVTMDRAQYLSILASRYGEVIAVAGTHGKTTTTGMIASAMKSVLPTVHIGAKYDYASVESSDVFITEACEYRRNFLHLNPSVAVLLNCELDHTDYYRDEEDIENAFSEFAFRSKKIIVNGDDERLCKIKHDQVVTFGLGENCHFRARFLQRNEKGGYNFTVTAYGLLLGEISLGVIGRHNVYNALCACVVALDYGLNFSEIASALNAFSGVNRRLEKVVEKRGISVYSDYAHHPTEVRASIRALRSEKRLIVVFEPHTYTRTCDLLAKFGRCFDDADELILAPVYGAREQGDDGTIEKLYAVVREKMSAKLCRSYDEISEQLLGTIKEGDCVVFIGAGRIDELCRSFARRI